MQQICLLNKQDYATEILEEEVIRERNEIPTYLKFYCVYQYDRIKFRKLMNIWLNTKEGQNRTWETLIQKQKEILEKCYILDENGKPLRDCDENHIYRIKTLYRIYEQIYFMLSRNVLAQAYNNEDDIIEYEEKGFRIWKEQYRAGFYFYEGKKYNGKKFDLYGANIIGTEELPLNDRLRIHIQALRELRNGQN